MEITLFDEEGWVGGLLGLFVPAVQELEITYAGNVAD